MSSEEQSQLLEHAPNLQTSTFTPENYMIKYTRQPIKKTVEFDYLSPEEQKAVELDYYKAYDVNDGIRTAAALGGFITFFILFIIYKTKCKSKRKYLSVSETLPFDDFTSKDARTSLDVSNIFSNSSSIKGSNLLLNPPEGLQSPTSHQHRTSNFSQSSGEGMQNHEQAGSCYSCECSSAAEASGGSVREHQLRVMSPTDSIEIFNADGRHSRRLVPVEFNAQNTSFLQEANINIQVIQPTPNVTPRGSIRMDSTEESCDENSPTHDIRMIIPLLTPLKSSRLLVHQTGRRRSESPHSGQNRVSFDRQSIGSDSVFLEDLCYEMPSVSGQKPEKRTRSDSKSSRSSSKKKKKSSEETYC